MPGEDAVFIEFDAPNSQATALDPQEDAIMTLDHSTREEPRAVRLTKALVWPLMVFHILSATVIEERRASDHCPQIVEVAFTPLLSNRNQSK